MSRVSAEIAAKQAEYAARPYAARVVTSNFSGTFRFHTEWEAIEYVMQQYGRMRRQIAAGERYLAMRLGGWRGCHIETPTGRYDAEYALLAPDLDSY